MEKVEIDHTQGLWCVLNFESRGYAQLNHKIRATSGRGGASSGAECMPGSVERVPKLLRILYSIKLGFLYRLMEQINESFIYEKIKLHTYYLLEIRD